MFERIRYSWRVMGASFEVLKKDKELLLFPMLSSGACLLVLLGFAAPLVMTGLWRLPNQSSGGLPTAAYYAVLFAFYFCNYFVMTFFNTAVVASAMIRLRGGEPTFGDGLSAATSRLPRILGWALLAATVGLVLRIIEERSQKIGRFVAGLLGAGFSLATFLVVPILVAEDLGPIDALKRSTALLRKTWGEQIIGGMSFGILYFLMVLPAVFFVVLGFALGGPKVGLAVVALAVLYFIVLALVQSTLQTIFEAAVYVYASEGRAPEMFGKELVANAVVPR